MPEVPREDEVSRASPASRAQWHVADYDWDPYTMTATRLVSSPCEPLPRHCSTCASCRHVQQVMGCDREPYTMTATRPTHTPCRALIRPPRVSEASCVRSHLAETPALATCMGPRICAYSDI